MHRVDSRRSNAGEGTHIALLRGKAGQCGRAMLEVGFEGWIGVFKISQEKKNSMCNGMVVIKEMVHFWTAPVQCAQNMASRDKKVRA